MNEREQYERADKALDALAQRHAAALAEANDRAEGLWVRHDTAQAELTRLRASNAALRAAFLRMIQSDCNCGQTGVPCREPARCGCDLELVVRSRCDLPQNPPQLERSATVAPELVLCNHCGKKHLVPNDREV